MAGRKANIMESAGTLRVGVVAVLAAAFLAACGSTGGGNTASSGGNSNGTTSAITGVTPADNYAKYSSELEAMAKTPVNTAKYKHSGEATIASIWSGLQTGWGETYKASLNYAAQQNGHVKVNWYDGGEDVNNEITSMENVIPTHPAAIILQPLDIAAMQASIAQANQAGIPVVLCASGSQGTDFVTWVDVDAYATGYEAADNLAKELNGKGQVAMFNGVPGNSSEVIWNDGARAALAKYPGIKIVGQYYEDWSIPKARSEAADMIASHPNVDGVFAGGSEGAVGVMEAYASAHKPMPVFGVTNPLNGFLRLAHQYHVKFWANPNGPSMSSVCFQKTLDILAGKQVNKFYNIANLLPGFAGYNQTEVTKYYEPALSDLWVPPATAPISFYKAQGLGANS